MLVVVLAVVLAGCGRSSGARAPDTTGPPTSQGTPAHSGVPSVIIDTDLGLWWDDATAIAMANVLEQRRELTILGIASDVPNRTAVAAIDAIDTAYGHTDVPLGAVAGSASDTAPHGYTDALVAKLPHTVRSSDDVPEAVLLYRRLLAAAADHSVTIVALGASTNLAGLLRSGPDRTSPLDGRALISAKVKRLVIEDGLFPNGGPALTNQKLDPASTAAIVDGAAWPTPIAWVDGFTGIQTKVGGSLCRSVGPSNPLRIVYEAKFGCGPPGDGDWDGPALLYAAGIAPSLFTELGQGGAAYVNPQGGLAWHTDPARPHDVYVHVARQADLNQTIEALLVAP